VNKAETKERTRSTYNCVGQDYDNWYWSRKAKELRAGLTEKVLGVLEKGLEDRKNPKILDLCCGTGHLFEGVSELGDYVGLDFAGSMVSECRERYPEGEFLLGDAEELPLRENSVDAVICFWSFHHIVYPEEVMDEIRRVLKPGGFVIIATFKDVKLNLVAKLGDMITDHYYGYTTNRYSEKEMWRLMAERFKSVDIKIYPKGFSLLNAMGIRFLIAHGRN
jgi:ubiquinone/menaquinone biosynthesis C-methylase UbiE